MALNRAGPSDADLTFSASAPAPSSSAGSAQGRIRLTEAAANGAEVEATGAGLAFRGSPLVIRALRLSGRGTLSRLPFTLNAAVEGDVPASFDGSGVYQRSGAVQTVALSGAGKIRGAAYRTGAPLSVTLGPDERAVQADLTIGKGRLTARAHETKAGFDANATASRRRRGGLRSRLVGQVDGTLATTGRGAALSGSLQGRLSNLRDADAPEAGALTADVRAQLAGETLRVAASGRDTSERGGGVRPGAAGRSVRRAAAPGDRPNPADQRAGLGAGRGPPLLEPVRGRREQPVGPDLRPQGTIGGNARISPAITGTANLQSGRLQDARTGARPAQPRARSRLQP